MHTYLSINDPLSSSNFLSVLKSSIRLCMNLWKYLFSCLGCCKPDSSDNDPGVVGGVSELCTFLGGPACEADISANTSRSNSTT